MTSFSSASPLTAAAALATDRALPSGLGAGVGALGSAAGEGRRELPVGEALLRADVEPQARGLGVQAHAARVLAALAGEPA